MDSIIQTQQVLLSNDYVPGPVLGVVKFLISSTIITTRKIAANILLSPYWKVAGTELSALFTIQTFTAMILLTWIKSEVYMKTKWNESNKQSF